MEIGQQYRQIKREGERERGIKRDSCTIFLFNLRSVITLWRQRPEDFADLLRGEAAHGTTVKILPQISSSASASVHSIASSIGYSSLEVADRKQLVRRQSDRELTSSLTAKVSNLLEGTCVSLVSV